MMLKLILLIFVIFPGSAIAADPYWIVYQGRSNQVFHPPGGSKYLMKIDSLGNVLISPRSVVTNSSVYVSPKGGATALSSQGPNRLNLWFVSRRSFFVEGNPVFKAAIDKKSTKLLSMGSTPLFATNFEYIQVTQKKQGTNFLSVKAYFPPFIDEFIGINSERPFVRETWRLTNGEDATSITGGGVSADGRFFFYKQFKSSPEREELYLQPLRANGRPLGNPTFITSELRRRGEIEALDVSSKLFNGYRYFIYRGGSSTSNTPIFIQKVEGESGQKIGAAVQIANTSIKTVFGAQSAAIDPSGRFVIYAGGSGSLYFQALDGTGRPSGNPKVIASGVEGGIDILKD